MNKAMHLPRNSCMKRKRHALKLRDLNIREDRVKLKMCERLHSDFSFITYLFSIENETSYSFCVHKKKIGYT